MADDTTDMDRDDELPASQRIEDLWELVDGMEIAMLTTRRADGRLVSRPMALQEHSDDGHLWFMADAEAHKDEEIAADPHVNLAFYKDRTREWVSISGRARLDRDRKRIHELYEPDWKLWLGDKGGVRNGGPDDPRITLIDVEVESAAYLKVDRPRVVVLFEVAKALITGAPANLGSQRKVTGDEIEREAPLR